MKERRKITIELMRFSFSTAFLTVLLLAVAPVVTAQQPGTLAAAPADIPETEINTLRQEIARISTQASAVKKTSELQSHHPQGQLIARCPPHCTQPLPRSIHRFSEPEAIARPR